MMYNESISADVAKPGSAVRDEASRTDTAGVVPSQTCQLAKMGGVLSNRAGEFTLQGRDAWLFISIKNRRFSRPYINWFIDMCEEASLRGHICPVDTPYLYNRMAELEADTLSDADAAKILTLSAETARKAQKAINGKCTKAVDIVDWSSIEDETPAVYLDEMRAAFTNGTAVREALFNHITTVKPITGDRSFERYAEFFLREVPVLLHAYYRSGATLDVYPGSQPAFFWQIEQGVFESELPALTALTRSGPSMLYLETHDLEFFGK